ncbi:MAG: hypothetical protein LBC13_01410 [Clostridiales bacterium]|jgi:hypothetical protein|nr:hypothetical protein [Clostridiales bacterium]
MWETVFETAAANGIWAVMFLGLLVYQLRDSRAREAKYQKTIESLSRSLENVGDVKDDIKKLDEGLTAYVFDKGGAAAPASNHVQEAFNKKED